MASLLPGLDRQCVVPSSVRAEGPKRKLCFVKEEYAQNYLEYLRRTYGDQGDLHPFWCATHNAFHLGHNRRKDD